jgi:hypothetical protein
VRAVKIIPPQLMSGGDAGCKWSTIGVWCAPYSEEVYGRRLIETYAALLGDTGADDTLDGARLLDQFLDPARFNLLRT